MKLKDKNTGEIGRLEEINRDEGYYLVVIDGNPQTYRYYHTLKEITDNYEDYEEPEKFWYINECGDILEYEYTGGCPGPIIDAEEIGNRFETIEEAKETKEKLKALTRLQKAGFVIRCGDPIFDYQGDHNESLYGMAEFEVANYEGIEEDLRTILGGKETAKEKK